MITGDSHQTLTRKVATTLCGGGTKSYERAKIISQLCFEIVFAFEMEEFLGDKLEIQASMRFATRAKPKVATTLCGGGTKSYERASMIFTDVF